MQRLTGPPGARGPAELPAVSAVSRAFGMLRSDCVTGNCTVECADDESVAERLLRSRPHPRDLSERPQRAVLADAGRVKVECRGLRERFAPLGMNPGCLLGQCHGEADVALTLLIGNKNYSSWSMRPWIAMKVAGIEFDEVVISLDAPDFKPRVSKISGTGKVPALDDDGIHVWESLAILEYLAERFPAAKLGRAFGGAGAGAGDLVGNARRLSALAARLPDEHVAAGQEAELNAEALANVRRIRRCGRNAARATAPTAPFLFGQFCAADRRCTRRWSRASHLRCRRRRDDARLHGRGHGAAGLGRMEGGRPEETWVLAEMRSIGRRFQFPG